MADDEDSSDDPFLEEIARISEVSFSSMPEAARPNGSRVGKFVLRGELGRGGMGIVYRADDEKLGRAVALKVLREETRADPQRRARFLREARSSAALVHRNVAAVYEIGEADGELYIAMELVAGESLRQRMVASGGALPVDEAVAIARGIARALAAAHAKGIVHRDLKPENVMLDAEGEPKVLDFGLAKVHESVPTPQEVLEVQPTEGLSTAEGRLLGTPAYMSPEQAQGKPVDLRTDVFSFGIVLFEMLAGERPFKGDSGMDLAIAIARDAPLDLERLMPGTPRWLAGIVRVCLVKAPAERYASARELGVALESPPAVADPPSPILRRTGTFALLALVAALIALGGFAARGRRAELPAAAKVAAVSDAGGSSRSFLAYPRPATKRAEAAEAYATAMQDLRDAWVDGAIIQLRRAVKLDPTFAAAYLRLLWPWNQTENGVVDARTEYALAQQYRASLDERDLALLDVAETFTHEPVDRSEAERRLRRVLERFPDDLEATAELADLLLDAGQFEDGRATCERALSIDPAFAFMAFEIADSHHYDPVVRFDLIDRCLALSPRAVSCLQLRALLDREKGRCADYERTARDILAMSPQGIRGNLLLADALAVRDAPIEGVRTLLENASARRVELDLQSAAENDDDDEIALGLVVGAFPRAMAAAADRERRHSTSTSENDHVEAALTILTSFLEEGRDDQALRIAEEFEKRTPAWSLNDDRVREYLLYARRHAGLVDELTFRQTVETLARAHTVNFVAQERPAADFWEHAAYATASSVDLDIARPYLDALQFSGHLEAIRGHLLFLAGRLDEALPPLHAGAATCEALPTWMGDGWQGAQAFTFMHSHLWLAEALEAKGDTAGACANYAVVTDRWKNAKPRSVTLEKAKARSRALHCAPAP